VTSCFAAASHTVAKACLCDEGIAIRKQPHFDDAIEKLRRKAALSRLAIIAKPKNAKEENLPLLQ